MRLDVFLRYQNDTAERPKSTRWLLKNCINCKITKSPWVGIQSKQCLSCWRWKPSLVYIWYTLAMNYSVKCIENEIMCVIYTWVFIFSYVVFYLYHCLLDPGCFTLTDVSRFTTGMKLNRFNFFKCFSMEIRHCFITNYRNFCDMKLLKDSF